MRVPPHEMSYSMQANQDVLAGGVGEFSSRRNKSNCFLRPGALMTPTNRVKLIYDAVGSGNIAQQTAPIRKGQSGIVSSGRHVRDTWRTHPGKGRFDRRITVRGRNGKREDSRRGCHASHDFAGISTPSLLLNLPENSS